MFSYDIANASANQIKTLKSNLNDFIENPTPDYTLAAREAVNNKRERLLRHDAIMEIFGQSLA